MNPNTCPDNHAPIHMKREGGPQFCSREPLEPITIGPNNTTPLTCQRTKGKGGGYILFGLKVPPGQAYTKNPSMTYQYP